MADIDLLKICDYIIENHATFEETSLHFGCSTETIRYYIKKLKLKATEKNFDIDWKKILDEIEKIKQQNQTIGKSKGGEVGKRKSNFTNDEIESIAKVFLANKWTLRNAKKELGNELGEKFSNLSKSRIHELLSSVKNPMIRKMIELQYEENLENFGNFQGKGK